MTSLINQADFFIQDRAAVHTGERDFLLQLVTVAMGAALTLAAMVAWLFYLILLRV